MKAKFYILAPKQFDVDIGQYTTRDPEKYDLQFEDFYNNTPNNFISNQIKYIFGKSCIIEHIGNASRVLYKQKVGEDEIIEVNKQYKTASGIILPYRHDEQSIFSKLELAVQQEIFNESQIFALYKHVNIKKRLENRFIDFNENNTRIDQVTPSELYDKYRPAFRKWLQKIKKDYDAQKDQ